MKNLALRFTVQAYWEVDAAGKTKEFMAYFHPEYSGWYSRNAMPTSKETSTRFIAQGHKTSKTLVYDIQPVAIKVHGNVAFVHYYYNQVGTNAEGKQEAVAGRWTDILLKQGDKWVLIGDNGGPPAKDWPVSGPGPIGVTMTSENPKGPAAADR